jgi:hypothetical protein
MRPPRYAATLSVALTAALLAAPTAAPAQAATPKCLDSAKTVAVKKLKAGGTTYGKVVITLSTEPQGDYTHVVCGYTVPAKRFAKRAHVVRQTFLHLADDGRRLGELRRDTYANKRAPVIYSSSWVPEGEKYVLKVRFEAGRTATAKVSYRVPSAS